MILNTDSGTVQEEAAILGVPSVTIRDTTERPETVEGGCNIVAGIKTGDICQALQTVMIRHKPGRVPDEYLATNVSETVCNIVTEMPI